MALPNSHELTPLCPPLYFIKRGKVTNIQCITPPLFVKQRGGMGGEFM
jgi:hypothetical protein